MKEISSTTKFSDYNGLIRTSTISRQRRGRTVQMRYTTNLQCQNVWVSESPIRVYDFLQLPTTYIAHSNVVDLATANQVIECMERLLNGGTSIPAVGLGGKARVGVTLRHTHGCARMFQCSYVQTYTQARHTIISDQARCSHDPHGMHIQIRTFCYISYGAHLSQYSQLCMIWRTCTGVSAVQQFICALSAPPGRCQCSLSEDD